MTRKVNCYICEEELDKNQDYEAHLKECINKMHPQQLNAQKMATLIKEIKRNDYERLPLKSITKRMLQEKVTYFANDYLDGSNSICREERQYTLFLYNKLTINNKTLKEKLGIESDWTIKEVFYEVALARDYKRINEAWFNERMKKFVSNNQILDSLVKCQRKKDKVYQESICEKLIRIKPDIGIIRVNESDYKEVMLDLIECKKESDEGNYKCDNLAECTKRYGEKLDTAKCEISQTDAQKLLLDFLCNELNLLYKLEDQVFKITKGNHLLVQFDDKNTKANIDPIPNSTIHIQIGDLF